jgi:hypothetical protein
VCRRLRTPFTIATTTTLAHARSAPVRTRTHELRQAGRDSAEAEPDERKALQRVRGREQVAMLLRERRPFVTGRRPLLSAAAAAGTPPPPYASFHSGRDPPDDVPGRGSSSPTTARTEA